MTVATVPTLLALLAVQQPAPDTLGASLRAAAEAGDSARVVALLAAGANPDAANPYGQTVLMEAVEGGHLAVVRLLLDAGADPNRADRDGDVALGYYASFAPDPQLVAALLEAGARVEGTADAEWPPLTWLAESGDTAVIRLMLAAGADVTHVAGDGATALLMSIQNEAADAARLLLDAGTDANAAWPEGGTALLSAIEMGLADLVPALLEHGADPTVKAANGYDVLMAAAELGDPDLYRRFVAAGVAPGGPTDAGYTLLMAAAFGGDSTLVREILEGGADVHAGTADGRTALDVASAAGHTAAARLLLDRGADVSTASDEGLTPVFRAAVFGHRELFDLLVDRGADLTGVTDSGVSVLMAAAEGGDSAIVARTLAAGADADHRDGEGRTALMGYAPVKGTPAVARMLLAAGADADADGPLGVTALMLAAENGHAEMLELLLAAGARVDATMTSGESPLMLAAQAGQRETAAALLAAGADLALANENGATALTVAAARGHLDLVEQLVAAGATLDAVTLSGLTAAELADDAGHDSVVTRLVAAGARPPRPLSAEEAAVAEHVARSELAAVVPPAGDFTAAQVTADGPAYLEDAVEAYNRSFGGVGGPLAVGGSRLVSLEAIAARFRSPRVARASVRVIPAMGVELFVERLLENLGTGDVIDSASGQFFPVPTAPGDTAVWLRVELMTSYARFHAGFLFFSRGAVRVLITATGQAGAVHLDDLLPVARGIDERLLAGTVGGEPVARPAVAPPPPMALDDAPPEDPAARRLLDMIPDPAALEAREVPFVDQTTGGETPTAVREIGGTGAAFRFRESELLHLRIQLTEHAAAEEAADAVAEFEAGLDEGASLRSMVAAEVGAPEDSVRLEPSGLSTLRGASAVLLRVRTPALSLDFHVVAFSEGRLVATVMAMGAGGRMREPDLRVLLDLIRNRLLSALIE